MAQKYKTLLGVDTGGTFTDFVFLEAGELKIHKVLSTPDSPERAILQGVDELQADRSQLSVVHGSTVATNAVLEGKGVDVAYITNKGVADVLTIGRQARRDLYDLNPEPVAPPVPRELCFELDVRVAADGSLLTAPEPGAIEALVKQVEATGVSAVAVNLLFSWLDNEHEQLLAEALPASCFVSLSSRVLAEYREYERGIATWINASVGPLMKGYLQRLQAGLAPADVAVMQSTGGTLNIEQAGDNAVRLLLSGPAGGLMGARYIGRLAGSQQLLTFDMGGTSTDVALIDGDIAFTSHSQMGAYPIAVPMVDMYTIGAGGGSLASCDAGGLLQVGPESAGAVPGPACYGQGGQQATVTDANVVLGRLPADAALGGSLSLDKAAAEAAVDHLADELGLDRQATAQGIIRLANEHMSRALRVISVERGIQVNDFTLTCFGGAGGLHVCALAELMGLERALVPVNSGVLSAMGMLVAPASREASRTLGQTLDSLDDAGLEVLFSQLNQQLEAEMATQDQLRCLRSVDVRYKGQSTTLNLDWQGLTVLEEAFHQAHQQHYGHVMEMPVELVNVRLRLLGPEPELDLPAVPVATNAEARVSFEAFVAEVGTVPCYQRHDLCQGHRITGPAIICEPVATVWLEAGWLLEIDAVGNILLQHQSAL